MGRLQVTISFVVRRQRRDTTYMVNRFGHFECGIQLANAELLHQLVAFGFFLRLGLRQSEIEAGRHGTEEHFQVLREDDAFGELARLFACGQYQRLLRGYQLPELCDFFHLVGWHR